MHEVGRLVSEAARTKQMQRKGTCECLLWSAGRVYMYVCGMCVCMVWGLSQNAATKSTADWQIAREINAECRLGLNVPACDPGKHILIPTLTLLLP